MKSVLEIVVLIWMLINPSSCYSCPSSDYTGCANEGGRCQITDTVKEGYLSYGANGRYNLIPFTNTKSDGTDITIECDNDHGDIIEGTVKSCCYIATDTGITFDFAGYISENDGGWHWNNNAWTMSYGTDNRYVYRVLYGSGTGWCNNGFFNDPVHGAGKHCQYSDRTPSIIDSHRDDSWVLCSNEGGMCNGLDSNAAQWVKYGDNGHYYFRLVIATDGQIPCSNNFFDDPLSGNNKYCWRSPAQYTFKNAVGSWERIPSCGGCASNEYKKTIGIEEMQSSEITTSWEWSFTTTVSASFGFKIGVSASVELSATVGGSVTNSLSSSFTQTTTLQTTYTCEKNSIYQWVTGATQNNGVFDMEFTIQSEDTWCCDSGLEPQCPPGFCANSGDGNCQTCTPAYYASSPLIDPNKYIGPGPQHVNNPWFGIIYMSNETITFIGYGLATLLLIVCIVMCYVSRKNDKKATYYSVKTVDCNDELSEASEANPINL